LVDGLVEVAREHPASGLLMGQAIYALTKFGRVAEAEELVQDCRSEGWWCEALHGLVLYAYAPLLMVEERFKSAFDEAPEDVRCRWGDAFWLLGDWDQRIGGLENLPPGREATADWGCARRLAASDTIFWWADPLFSQEGNDRWAVHMARAVAGDLYQDLRRVMRGSDPPRENQERDWAMRIRRGPWDSYERLPGRNAPRFWTSEEAARFHFVPELLARDLRTPTWSFSGDIQDEGYSPDYGPFFHLSSQFARFRDGDSLFLVAAGGLETTRLRRVLDATSYLVLSDGPRSFPLRIRRETRQAVPVLQGRARHGAYTASLEVETALGHGVARELLPSLSHTGPELSDLLLYTSAGEEDPATLEVATGAMMGTTRLEEGGMLGVFWEVYGAPPGEPLFFEITLHRETGGLVERLTGLFPGGEEGERGRVVWREPAAGMAHPRGLTLNLTGLREGDYHLVLAVRWEGSPLLERRRSFRVR
jgi:hypothetical protein